MMEDIKQCKTRLREIALRPDPLTVEQHIELMIKVEETQGQPGFKRRIRILKEFKRIGLVDEQIQDFHQNLKLTGDDFTSATGKTNTVSGLAPNKGKGSIVFRGVNYLRSLFV